MSLWLENHEKIEWPDLSISQPEDACHLSIRGGEHFERVIKEMCSEGFFTVHGYIYVQWDATAKRVPEEVYDDVEGKDCTQGSSCLQDEELYEVANGNMEGKDRTQNSSYLQDEELYEKADDFGYEILNAGVTETNLQEEELYDDVRGTTVIEDPKVFSTEPRYQNVQTNVIKTAVDMVTDVPCDYDAYDEI